ncbi:LPS export ABC transporter periplasmic protein LptC [Persephonella sp.]
MKTKVLTYAVIFFLLVFLFYHVSHMFETVEISSLDYQKGEITDFILTGVNSDRYVLKGKKILDTGSGYSIEDFNLIYLKNDEKTVVSSKQGVYVKEKDILDLIGDVKIVSGELTMETQFLRILVKERRAFNTNKVKMYTEYMETRGDNIFINLKENRLKLEDVTTVYRGK